MSDIPDNYLAAIERLSERITALENRAPAPMSPADQRTFMKAIGQFIIDEVRKEVKKAVTEIYKGTYQRGNRYIAGQQVTHDGSMFVALCDVEPLQVPGQHPAWQLAVKSGPRQGSYRSHQPP
jgi:hypothetical protein